MRDDTAQKNGLRGGLNLLGIGVAACVACCIGPIVAFLGSIGVLGVLSSPFIGISGPIVAAAATAAAVIIRRRRKAACSVLAGPVTVDAPVRRKVPT